MCVLQDWQRYKQLADAGQSSEAMAAALSALRARQQALDACQGALQQLQSRAAPADTAGSEEEKKVFTHRTEPLFQPVPARPCKYGAVLTVSFHHAVYSQIDALLVIC